MNAVSRPAVHAVLRACLVSFLAFLPVAALALPVSERLNAVNPAAVYCEKLGYEYRIVSEPAGQRGVCVLPDGREVDAWEFYRGKIAREYSYCAKNGYITVAKRSDADGYVSECAVCVSRNGKELGTVAELMGLELEPARSLDPGASQDETGSAAGSDAAARDEEPASSPRPGEAGNRHAHGTRYVPISAALPFGVSPPSSVALPEKFDWRQLDGCTAVKDQGNCGSCWAFSTVGALECNILIKDAIEVDLSEQWLVSCNRDGWNCGGGDFAHKYHMKTPDSCGGSGAVLESDFGYAAANLLCDCPYPHPFALDAWSYIDPSVEVPDADLIKRAIMAYGPISVGVYADNAFGSYHGGIFTGTVCHDINHAVVLVGWDDTQGLYGVWYLRNSWGTMWGEQGYMRISRGSNAVGYLANWVEYAAPVAISPTAPVPSVLEPGVRTEIEVALEARTDTAVPGAAAVHYRFHKGKFYASPLASLGSGQYLASLPEPACGDTVEFFFSASGERYGTVYDPPDPLAHPYVAGVGTTSSVFHDDFEADRGWTVESSPSLEHGAWERAVPSGQGDLSDPPADYDGSGACCLTGNTDGDSDVDSGSTRLVSPVFDLSGGEEAVVEFALWYRNDEGDVPNLDYLDVYLSDDDGATWVLAESVGPRSPLPIGWKRMSLLVGEHVTLSDSVRVAIEVSDRDDDSLVEAALDDFSVKYLSCGMEERIFHSGALTLDGSVTVAADHLSLGPNTPNPFNPETTISFVLPDRAAVSLIICDSTGRVVRRLLNGEVKPSGRGAVIWDGRDDSGARAASGVYFCRLESKGRVLSRKMVLLK
jgi:C1A family cysteine protease/putative hemolysin